MELNKWCTDACGIKRLDRLGSWVRGLEQLLQITYTFSDLKLFLSPPRDPYKIFTHLPKQTIPESYFLLTAGAGCPWASPASPWSAAGPGSPGISPLPRCILYTPETGVSPCLLSVRGPWLRSAEPLSQIQPNAGEARGGRRPGGAWRRAGREKGGFWLVRATLEECFQMIAGGEYRRPVTAGGRNRENSFSRQIDIERRTILIIDRHQ